MRGTILDYVRDYGQYNLREMPFNEVDSLVLAKFVYLKLEKIIQPGYRKKYAMSLKQLSAHPEMDCLFEKDDNEALDRALFREMCASKRFGAMKCTYVVANTSKEEETQFMAMTCILPNGQRKVVFRGTDGSLIGWKENFNMAFECPVSGQKRAQEYLKRVMFWGLFRVDVIGHSKGGNLAVYAAMKASKFMQSRIVHIYNLDGPGFRSEVFAQSNYDRIVHKIRKFIPRVCMVGLLLDMRSPYRVVDSEGDPLTQHDLYSWPIHMANLVYIEDEKRIYRIFSERFCNKLMSLPQEELEATVNKAYQMICSGKRVLTETGQFFSDTFEDLQAFFHKERT